MRFLKIVLDESPENPREWDNLGTMVCWHKRYDLGDKHAFGTPEDFWRFVRKNGGEKQFVVLPLYLYDHSGLAMSTRPFNDPWDSGQVGYIYASYAKIKENFGVKKVTAEVRQKVEELLKGEVEEYSLYLEGRVYGFVAYSWTGHNFEVEDSCYGFFGEDPKENGLTYYVPEEFALLLEQEGSIYAGQVFLLNGDGSSKVFSDVRELRDYLEDDPQFAEALEAYKACRSLLAAY